MDIIFTGLYGEIRDWRDGTTLTQKTHDAGMGHVTQDFDGDAILLLRNPDDAILSDHNYLYAGHHGTAPNKNFKRQGTLLNFVTYRYLCDKQVLQ